MRKLITAIALVAVVDSSMAIAQQGRSRNTAMPSSMNLDPQSLPQEPVGHRQPRADPDGSKRSNQSGECGARPHDQWHLSRLLSNASSLIARPITDGVPSAPRSDRP